jgi:hypothetical protein
MPVLVGEISALNPTNVFSCLHGFAISASRNSKEHIFVGIRMEKAMASEQIFSILIPTYGFSKNKKKRPVGWPLLSLRGWIDYFGRILYMPVPQTVHLPFIAGRPFFIVTFSVSFIVRFCLHLTQYASSAMCYILHFEKYTD